jgi:hypothetical protein
MGEKFFKAATKMCKKHKKISNCQMPSGIQEGFRGPSPGNSSNFSGPIANLKTQDRIWKTGDGTKNTEHRIQNAERRAKDKYARGKGGHKLTDGAE